MQLNTDFCQRHYILGYPNLSDALQQTLLHDFTLSQNSITLQHIQQTQIPLFKPELSNFR